MANLIGKKVLVRSYEAGVYFGTLSEKEGNEVTLKNVRNIWRWNGASCLSQIANDGVAESSKLSPVVDEMVILNVCQIIPCTDKAISNLEGIKVWEY